MEEIANYRRFLRLCDEIVQLGEEGEVFYKKETASSLSGKIIPSNPVPEMSICIDGTGVPVVKAETVNRKGKGENCHAKTRETK